MPEIENFPFQSDDPEGSKLLSDIDRPFLRRINLQINREAVVVDKQMTLQYIGIRRRDREGERMERNLSIVKEQTLPVIIERGMYQLNTKLFYPYSPEEMEGRRGRFANVNVLLGGVPLVIFIGGDYKVSYTAGNEDFINFRLESIKIAEINSIPSSTNSQRLLRSYYRSRERDL
jgi:hypothetical protein